MKKNMVKNILAIVILFLSPSLNVIASPNESKHVFKADETLWFLAQVYYGSGLKYVDIIKANKLKNESAVAVGQELVIPHPKYPSEDHNWQERYEQLYKKRAQALMNQGKTLPVVKNEKSHRKNQTNEQQVQKTDLEDGPKIELKKVKKSPTGAHQLPLQRQPFDGSAKRLANEELNESGR
jgi:hypothetical protein